MNFTPKETYNTRTPFSLIFLLFFISFGYGLLSVCLFRLLCFSTSSTAFFMLYIGFGFPLGAYLVEQKRFGSFFDLNSVTALLIPLSILVPVIGLLSAHGPDPLVGALYSSSLFNTLWIQIVYNTIVTCPFFILWGVAEYVGFKTALDSNRLNNTFYLIFIVGLLFSFVIATLCIPLIGLLQTIAIVPIFALLIIIYITRKKSKFVFRILFFMFSIFVVLFGIHKYEDSYMIKLFPNKAQHAGYTLKENRHYISREPLPSSVETNLLDEFWGKYCHLSFIHSKGIESSEIFGAYDGIVLWRVSPVEHPQPLFEEPIFQFVEDNSDICILGAGGGAQVRLALTRNPKSVVAVDIIPEVFDALKNDLSWTNKNVYNSPLVETVVADGISYLKQSSRKFDLILLPYTESYAAIFKSFFEPGQRIHTVESFEIIKQHLKENGIIAVIKMQDKDSRLFNTYAKTLQTAGLNVIGHQSKYQDKRATIEPFILLATNASINDGIGPLAKRTFNNNVVDFQEIKPQGDVIYNDSPWISGFLGVVISQEALYSSLLFPSIILSLFIFFYFLHFIYRKKKKSSVLKSTFFALAGIFIGINAISLENGMIFWLINHLMNPLSAFYVGTSLFLFIWGLSNFALKKWKFILIPGVIYVTVTISLLLFDHSVSHYILILMIFCSGLCFPLIALNFKSELLNLFVFDAFGGLVGGLLAIWLPVLFGLKNYFDMLPWICLVTLLLTITTVTLYTEREE